MKTLMLQFFLLACFVAESHAKIYGRCELAQVLKMNGLDGYQGYSLANWVCLAFFESGFDTQAVDRNSDGTKDYGIFQINSGWWCASDDKLSENICDTVCKDFLDPDLDDDILCAKKIVKDPKGMGAWDEWRTHCENQNLGEWVKGCDL